MQAGPSCVGDAIDLTETAARFFERTLEDGNDVHLVGPRSKFGNHAAILRVNVLYCSELPQ